MASKLRTEYMVTIDKEQSDNWERARAVRLFVMDVDGTLTDGAMYYSDQGEVLKRFSTRDGMGITLLRKAGIEPAIITSENSAIVSKRAEKLGITNVILGSHDKTTALLELAKKKGIDPSHIAYIGDDVNDLHVMQLCGLSACPSDAVEAIRLVAQHICQHQGGNGAVREFAEFVLRAQGKPVTISENW